MWSTSPPGYWPKEGRTARPRTPSPDQLATARLRWAARPNSPPGPLMGSPAAAECARFEQAPAPGPGVPAGSWDRHRSATWARTPHAGPWSAGPRRRAAAAAGSSRGHRAATAARAPWKPAAEVRGQRGLARASSSGSRWRRGRLGRREAVQRMVQPRRPVVRAKPGRGAQERGRQGGRYRRPSATFTVDSFQDVRAGTCRASSSCSGPSRAPVRSAGTAPSPPRSSATPSRSC